MEWIWHILLVPSDALKEEKSSYTFEEIKFVGKHMDRSSTYYLG
jgi:hypothetical protein